MTALQTPIVIAEAQLARVAGILRPLISGLANVPLLAAADNASPAERAIAQDRADDLALIRRLCGVPFPDEVPVDVSDVGAVVFMVNDPDGVQVAESAEALQALLAIGSPLHLTRVPASLGALTIPASAVERIEPPAPAL